MPRLFPYMHVENFLDEDLSQQILAYAINNQDLFTQSLVGKEGEINEKIRISHVSKELGPWEAVIQEKIEAFYPQIRQGLGMGDFNKRSNFEIELAAHGDGAFFKPHIDMRLGETEGRVISTVYYLHGTPKNFTGGGLRIYPNEIFPGNDQPVVLEPTHNSLAVFQSYVHHEVLRVSCPSGEFKDFRFAVNCWIHKA